MHSRRFPRRMGTIWTNRRVIDTLNKIAKQQHAWLVYAIFTPLIFGFTGLVIYMAERSTSDMLFWSYAILVAVTCVSWWLWTMWVFHQMVNSHRIMFDMMNNISEDLKDIKVSILKEKDLTKIK